MEYPVSFFLPYVRYSTFGLKHTLLILLPETTAHQSQTSCLYDTRLRGLSKHHSPLKPRCSFYPKPRRRSLNKRSRISRVSHPSTQSAELVNVHDIASRIDQTNLVMQLQWSPPKLWFLPAGRRPSYPRSPVHHT